MSAAEESHDAPAPPPQRRPEIETLLGRAMKLRCPRCGQGKLFRGWFTMEDRCSNCRFEYDRGPGYYLGSSYVNYGITAVIITIVFLVGRMIYGIPGNILFWPLVAFCVIFPLLIFRHARAIWLALDCQFDRSLLDDAPDMPDSHSPRS